MKMLGRIVRANRRVALRFERAFPRFFRSRDYVEELRRRVVEACEQRHAKDVPEVGGIDRPLHPRSGDYTYSWA